jgi:[acyl-carrier-protein] S-malonyltransferase
MAAVIGLGGFKTGILVDKARNGDVLDLANYNSPQQLVISGKNEAVERACKIAPELGAKKCMMINVSAPFHSDLMKPAAEKFRTELEKIEFEELGIPVIANFNAVPYPSKEFIIDLLTKQVDHPVLYYQSVKYVIENGADAIIEVGPGRVLTGLNKRILPKDSSVALANFGKPEDLGAVRAITSGGVAGA